MWRWSTKKLGAVDCNFAGEDDEEVGAWVTMVESRFGAVWPRIVAGRGVSEWTEWMVA